MWTNLRDFEDLSLALKVPISYKKPRTSQVSWQKYGCSIIASGWTNLKKKPIINILVFSCISANDFYLFI